MRGIDLLEKMELVDPAYVEEAETCSVKKKHNFAWWAAAAACLCLCLWAAIHTPWSENMVDDPVQGDPLPEKIVLSEGSTARVEIGIDAQTGSIDETQLLYFSEEEMFGREEMYIFRGRVSALTNLTIDFNGVKVVRCLATVVIDRVYQGGLTAGEQVRMLLPGLAGMAYSDDHTVAAQIESGMEGIFMPWTYNESSVWKQNGATLMVSDLAPCGLADGLRWVFLQTDDGLVFEKTAYPGAVGAASLDDVEAYVLKMLE